MRRPRTANVLLLLTLSVVAAAVMFVAAPTEHRVVGFALWSLLFAVLLWPGFKNLRSKPGSGTRAA
jgi:hypothetical protein